MIQLAVFFRLPHFFLQFCHQTERHYLLSVCFGLWLISPLQLILQLRYDVQIPLLKETSCQLFLPAASWTGSLDNLGKKSEVSFKEAAIFAALP